MAHLFWPSFVIFVSLLSYACGRTVVNVRKSCTAEACIKQPPPSGAASQMINHQFHSSQELRLPTVDQIWHKIQAYHWYADRTGTVYCEARWPAERGIHIYTTSPTLLRSSDNNFRSSNTSRAFCTCCRAYYGPSYPRSTIEPKSLVILPRCSRRWFGSTQYVN